MNLSVIHNRVAMYSCTSCDIQKTIIARNCIIVSLDVCSLHYILFYYSNKAEGSCSAKFSRSTTSCRIWGYKHPTIPKDFPTPGSCRNLEQEIGKLYYFFLSVPGTNTFSLCVCMYQSTNSNMIWISFIKNIMSVKAIR